MRNWQQYSENNEDLVISSRIRVARNLNNRKFSHKLRPDEERELVKEVEDSLFKASHIRQNYEAIHLWECSDLQATKYLEEHLISKELIKNKEGSAFILGENDTVSIMINEEDHIRLQCISAGLNLRESYALASRIDDLIEESVEYAFDEKIGYITACPTNLGTGLRCSAMIHLPALTMNNEMNGILKALTQVGMTIRGLYGEGSKALGNIYQISNQITLGLSEEDIISNLEAVVNEIIGQEIATRNRLYSTYRYELEDKIYRSLGILRSAALLNINECFELLSSVRMGVEMGIIKDVDKCLLNQLLVETQPASLQLSFNTRLNEKELNINRARLVRETLK
ncbi:MAG: protein arginine kinase [Clostridiales bacterium]|nr:protein arginine kinase [Clostridiales bacterium]